MRGMGQDYVTSSTPSVQFNASFSAQGPNVDSSSVSQHSATECCKKACLRPAKNRSCHHCRELVCVAGYPLQNKKSCGKGILDLWQCVMTLNSDPEN